MSGPSRSSETPGSPPGRAFEQLSWNGSVDNVYRFGGAPAFDDFGSQALQIERDGRLVTPAGRVDEGLLVENFAVQLHLRDALLVSSAMGFELWRPIGTPRADWVVFGRFYDGWLAGRGTVVVWPDATGRTPGTLRFVLTSPAHAAPLRITFGGDGFRHSVFLRPGERRAVAVPIDVRGPWVAAFTSTMHTVLADGRPVSVRVAGPTFERLRAPTNSNSA